jgi:hypothetical protein
MNSKMKKIIIYLILAIITISCEDVLNKRDLSAIDGQDVWNDPNLSTLFLNTTYQYALPGFAGTSNTNISDESFGSGSGGMMYGFLTKDEDYGIYSSSSWYVIRQTNTLINEVLDGTMPDEDRTPILGQAYFLRAWTYWELVKYYGGIPIIFDAQDPSQNESLYVKRNSAKECIEMIVSDLDKAISSLPTVWTTEKGRATKAAAAALKGRILLFYASPQFNPDNEQARWQDAYNANLEAKNVAEESGHALYPDYSNIFLDEDNSTEGIFITRYDNPEKVNSYETNVRPRSVSNSSDYVRSAPSWSFVKSYPMYDGTPATDHSEYDSVFFWKNRDPRFYATIAYNGMIWDFDGSENRRQWSYLGNKVEPSNSAQGATVTGFYLKKNINTSIAKTQTPYGTTDWIEIRLAEVYLNLAECAAELGKLDEARNLLIAIRERAGIEDKDGTFGISASNNEEMVEAVLFERKIELAFEDKRHWDLRRRNLFINGIGNTARLNGLQRQGLEIRLDTAYIRSISPGLHKDSIFYHFENVIMDTLDLDAYYDDFFSSSIIYLDQIGINFLQPKYNFYFVPTEEMEKNINLQQTINWTEVDPFDPLAE